MRTFMFVVIVIIVSLLTKFPGKEDVPLFSVLLGIVILMDIAGYFSNKPKNKNYENFN